MSGEPIWDEAAERSVLGAVLLSSAALADVAGLLTGEDFYRPAHGVIWDRAVGLWAAGQAVDPVTVAAELDRRGELMRAGGGPYLHTIIHDVPTTANVRFYVDIVTSKAVLRRVVQAGVRITQYAESGANGAADLGEVLDFVRREVAQATDTHDPAETMVPVRTAVWDLIEGLADPPVGVVRTPWPELDDLFSGGFRQGDLVVVAANTSVGKSLVGGACAKAAAQDGIRTVLFSLEMTREELMSRWVADVGTVPLEDLIGHTVNPEDAYRAKRAAERIEEWPLWVDDTPGLSVAQIRSRVQQLGDVGMVVVDQLSLVAAADQRAPREQQVSRIAWELKDLAKQLGCPVVVLHQLNGDPLKRMNSRPTGNDLRESRAVGHHASRVLLLWRPDGQQGDLGLIVDKNRNGPTGEITLRMHGRYARVTSGSW